MINSWSIALTICSIAVLFLILRSAFTAIRVVRFWDINSDSHKQIKLEDEIWLSSTLVQYALFFQIFTLIILVIAANDFSNALIGAMCATGSFLANNFGVPALLIKLLGVFLYATWIAIHRLDIKSEYYPLVKIKFIFLLYLIPVLGLDVIFQFLFLLNLSPDIITSCCGVIFDPKKTTAIILEIDTNYLLIVFYTFLSVLLIYNFYFLKKIQKNLITSYHIITNTILWISFLFLSLVSIITIFSSYIYAMPFHHCPFCILKYEYNYFGYLIYLFLFSSVFLGINNSIMYVLLKKFFPKNQMVPLQAKNIKKTIILLILFAFFTSIHFLLYTITGGEL